MKQESKSARNRVCLILFLLSCGMTLTACADVKVPNWLTGEPDASVLNAPRVVEKPAPLAQKDWPNLSEVPDTKPKFSDLATRNEKSRDLKSDNLKAQAEMERIRNIPLEEMRTPETMLNNETTPFSAPQP